MVIASKLLGRMQNSILNYPVKCPLIASMVNSVE